MQGGKHTKQSTHLGTIHAVAVCRDARKHLQLQALSDTSDQEHQKKSDTKYAFMVPACLLKNSQTAHLLDSLVEGHHGVVAALPQHHALHARHAQLMYRL